MSEEFQIPNWEDLPSWEEPTGELDLRGEVCPYTLVKTRHALAEIGVGETLKVRLDDPYSAKDVPAVLRREGQEITSICQDRAGEWLLEVRKKR